MSIWSGEIRWRWYSLGIRSEFLLQFAPLTKFFVYIYHLGRNFVRELEFRFKYLPPSTLAKRKTWQKESCWLQKKRWQRNCSEILEVFSIVKSDALSINLRILQSRNQLLAITVLCFSINPTKRELEACTSIRDKSH